MSYRVLIKWTDEKTNLNDRRRGRHRNNEGKEESRGAKRRILGHEKKRKEKKRKEKKRKRKMKMCRRRSDESQNGS